MSTKKKETRDGALAIMKLVRHGETIGVIFECYHEKAYVVAQQGQRREWTSQSQKSLLDRTYLGMMVWYIL
ncbi:MAG: hypothetical protein ACJ8AG_16870 [Ktedonobacteraceae bacterium]|jgi:cation transport regulator ChaC